MSFSLSTVRSWAVLSVLYSAILGLSLATAAEKPHVLFIMTDDQRADTIHALGNGIIKTPNLDQLVAQGMSFNRAYCFGGNNAAVCTPSRNMFLSGRTYFRWEGEKLAPADGPNFPVAMKEGGYETWHCGKKGNTATLIQATFEHNTYIDENKERTSGEHGRQIVDNAIEFLTTRKDERPVFMYLGLEGPHDPRVAAKKYLDMYQESEIPLPSNYQPFHPFDNGELFVRDEKLAPWPRMPYEVQKHLRDYYGCITAIDYHLGRLFQTLRTLNIYDNTLIVFTSDHGLAIGSHGLFGKQNLYEAGMKVPLIIAGPNVKQKQSQAMCYLHDIFPTVCDMTGIKAPGGLDGISFAKVLTGDEEYGRPNIMLAYLNVQRAFNDGRFKIICYPQISKVQLFDLQLDPFETKDISHENPDKVRDLKDQLAKEQEKLCDRCPLTCPSPSPAEMTLQIIRERTGAAK
jgi:arylsulfatase A-like enzyme